MSFRWIFFFVVFSFQLAYSQDIRIDSVIITPAILSETQEIEVPQYDISRQSQYIIYMPMNYSKFLFTEEDRKMFYTLRDTLIERIDLVYTVFRRSKSFDQVKLNKERYEMFQKYFPQAFNNNLIDWNLYAQDGAADYKEAQTYFHGFVIYLKPHRVTTKDGVTIGTVMDLRVDDPGTRKLETNEEVAKIRTLLTATGATKTVYDTTYTVKKKRVWTGMYYSKNKAKFKKGIKYKTEGPNRPKEYITKEEKVPKITSREVPDLTALPNPRKVLKKISEDSVVYSVMDRAMTKWEDYVVVQDVTGSMHPYLAQTLLYLQTHIEKNSTEKFVFFNDGDDKPDGPIGYSGGCYYVSSDNVKEIEEMAFEAMNKGRGGKEAENDIEAILYGIKKFPKCKGVVLIADNFSRVRDFKLIPQIMKLGKPVRVILCGLAKDQTVNIDYINLARYTGGSLHTINGDLMDLANKKEGEVFKVGSQQFKIEKNGIKLLHQKKFDD